MEVLLEQCLGLDLIPSLWIPSVVLLVALSARVEKVLIVPLRLVVMQKVLCRHDCHVVDLYPLLWPYLLVFLVVCLVLFVFLQLGNHECHPRLRCRLSEMQPPLVLSLYASPM